MVRVENFEISTSRSQSERSASELHSVLSFRMVPRVGLEPTRHEDNRF